MKVKELIDKLKNYPEDMEVIILDVAWGDNMDIIAVQNSDDNENAIEIVAKA